MKVHYYRVDYRVGDDAPIFDDRTSDEFLKLLEQKAKEEFIENLEDIDNFLRELKDE